MGLKWDIDHMQKGFFINEFGEILEVKNVYENNKISIEKIQIGEKIYSVDNYKNYFDYNTSFDDIQFSSPEQRDLKMEKILYELAEIKAIDTSFYSKKKLKSGEEKTYFCERKTSLANTFFFYHKNTVDHPHFHINLPKNIPLGKDCLKLRKELNKVFVKNNIVPNCEILVEKNNIGEGKYEIREFQQVKKTLEKISWLYRQAESKVTNPKMSISEFLNNKKIIYKGVEIYQANHCYFTIQKNKSFTMSKLMLRGKNKGKIEEIKVHSLQETFEKYVSFANRAGSGQFLKELIERVEMFENIEIDKKYLEKYEKIDFSNEKAALKTLLSNIENGNKLSPDYKEFWRENINSEIGNKKELAEGIAELYKFRKNNIINFDKQKLITSYNKCVEKLEKKYADEIILKKFEEYLSKEKISENGVLEELKNEFKIKNAYLKKIDEKQCLICDKQIIDISFVLKNYSIKYKMDFKTAYQIIKYNQIEKITLEDIENIELREISEIVLDKVIQENKKEIIENCDTLNLKSDITAIISDNQHWLIEMFTDTLASGLEAILECFKAVLGYFKENINFSEFEEEKIKKLSEEMVDDFDFDVFRDERNELQ